MDISKMLDETYTDIFSRMSKMTIYLKLLSILNTRVSLYIVLERSYRNYLTN